MVCLCHQHSSFVALTYLRRLSLWPIFRHLPPLSTSLVFVSRCLSSCFNISPSFVLFTCFFAAFRFILLSFLYFRRLSHYFAFFLLLSLSFTISPSFLYSYLGYNRYMFCLLLPVYCWISLFFAVFRIFRLFSPSFAVFSVFTRRHCKQPCFSARSDEIFWDIVEQTWLAFIISSGSQPTSSMNYYCQSFGLITRQKCY